MAGDGKFAELNFSLEIPSSEIERQARNLEFGILTLTREEFVDGKRALQTYWVNGDERKDGNCSKYMGATLATTKPVESHLTSAALGKIFSKGLHGVGSFRKVLFIDCSPILRTEDWLAQAEESENTTWKTSGKLASQILTATLNALDRNNIDINRYFGVRDPFYPSWMGEKHLPQQNLSLLFENLATGHGVLKPEPIHIFPVFNFDAALLPYINTNDFPSLEQSIPININDQIIQETAKFYRLAELVNRSAQSPKGDSYEKNLYGMFGRVFIVPDLVLHLLGQVSREYCRNKYQDKLVDALKTKGYPLYREIQLNMQHIAGGNFLMARDILQGKIIEGSDRLDLPKPHCYLNDV